MSDTQMIISIGREYGSGGHEIAENIAARFGLPLYDYNLAREIAIERNLDIQKIDRYDEIPKNRILSRTVRGYSSSPEENIANMQFDFLRKKAETGDSFVIVGRCAETILKGYDGLITFFVLADIEKKVERIAKINGLSETDARNLIRRHDKKRKAYHNYYCEGKWGDSRNYDFSINSSKLGVQETADLMIDYIGRIEKIR